ncbi:alpha/beta fold hydrolase [Rubrobacter tropicus]|uniref:Alpha/beta fold hydrolase n=1 Tax=Rubrobacter tropicus TaxID=2653851 RepID=A0A6G8QBS8_9ACTN|nr:alpha/beta fold hydrolase [Rubrobacter tropicus]QIN83893.1 alpha/beta fold hydrolase [Rubrobacter tropicus]
MRSIYRSPEGEAELMSLYDEALARLGPGCETRTIGTVAGLTHVIVAGPEDAPPLVVLQGGNFLNPLCLAWFLPLANEYRLYAPDIIGQPGRSAQSRPSARGDGHARWLVDVLDGLGLGLASFVGISYGAGLILRLAGLAPGRIDRAVLVSPAGVAAGPIRPMLRQVALPMLLYRASPNPERLLRAACPILTEPEEPYVRQLGAVYRHVRLDRQLPRAATKEELSGYGSPTLLFAAQDDLFFPAERTIPRAREIISNLEAETLPGRHVPSNETFARVNDRAAAFLKPG